MHLIGCITTPYIDGTVEAVARFNEKFLTVSLKVSPDSATMKQATQINCSQLIERLQKDEELEYQDSGKF